MRKIPTAALLCAMVFAGTSAFAQAGGQKMAAAKPAEKPSPVADALMKKETAMMAQVQKKDWATFKKSVMPGAWSVDEGGYMTVDDFVKTASDPKSGFSWEYKISDMKVIPVDADSSIVTYKVDQKGSFMGQSIPPVVYATTVWANHGGNWMAVFHQESTAAPPAKK